MENLNIKSHINYIRILIKHYLEEMVLRGHLTLDEAKKIAVLANEIIHIKISSEEIIKQAISQFIEKCPQMDNIMDIIMKESIWFEKQKNISEIVYPLIKENKLDQALANLRYLHRNKIY